MRLTHKKDLAALAEADFVRSLRFYGFTVRSALAFLQKGHELKIFIQILSGIGYALAHLLHFCGAGWFLLVHFATV